jgi:amino acid permease
MHGMCGVCLGFMPVSSEQCQAGFALNHRQQILALMLAIMTAMAGSSRTLYQGSVDGWLPRYLSHVNEHGAPTRAMWTDLIVNLVVLAIACADATAATALAYQFVDRVRGQTGAADSSH